MKHILKVIPLRPVRGKYYRKQVLIVRNNTGRDEQIRSGSYNEVINKINELNLSNRIIFLGEITEDQKDYLYRNCEGYVFPSFAEGFGIPPIEAMLYGKPVFVSDKTSIPEICGNLAFYWTSFESGNMANILKQGMELYNKNPNYAEQLKKFASRYSWEENVNQYLALYRNLLN